jgi:hypothetical protein
MVYHLGSWLPQAVKVMIYHFYGHGYTNAKAHLFGPQAHDPQIDIDNSIVAEKCRLNPVQSGVKRASGIELRGVCEKVCLEMMHIQSMEEYLAEDGFYLIGWTEAPLG